jgi:topoisomerase IA-like protein
MSEWTLWLLVLLAFVLMKLWDRFQSERKKKIQDQRRREEERIEELEDQINSLEDQFRQAEDEKRNKERKELIEKISVDQKLYGLPKVVGKYYKSDICIDLAEYGISIRWKDRGAHIPYSMNNEEDYDMAIAQIEELNKEDVLPILKKEISYQKSLIIKDFAGRPKIQIIKLGSHDKVYIKCAGKSYYIPENQDPKLLDRYQCELLIKEQDESRKKERDQRQKNDGYWGRGGFDFYDGFQL